MGIKNTLNIDTQKSKHKNQTNISSESAREARQQMRKSYVFTWQTGMKSSNAVMKTSILGRKHPSWDVLGPNHPLIPTAWQPCIVVLLVFDLNIQKQLIFSSFFDLGRPNPTRHQIRKGQPLKTDPGKLRKWPRAPDHLVKCS